MRITFSIVLLAVATSSLAHTARPDTSRRDPAMAWPRGLDPAHADVFDHNVLRIETGCDAVYRRLAAPAGWPSWFLLARDVRLAAPGSTATAGSRFSWSILGTHVDSRVFVAEPGRRFGYVNTPPGPPPAYAQSWLLTPRGADCLVTTEEVGIGAAARRATASGDRHVRTAHDLWLAALRWVSLFGTP